MGQDVILAAQAAHNFDGQIPTRQKPSSLALRAITLDNGGCRYTQTVKQSALKVLVFVTPLLGNLLRGLPICISKYRLACPVPGPSTPASLQSAVPCVAPLQLPS